MKYLVILCVIWTLYDVTSTESSCDVTCRCEFEPEDTTVTCEGESIKRVPKDIPRNVTKLYLSGTSISSLQKGSFTSFPDLKQIDSRQSCMLENIEPGSFGGLKYLRIIGLIGCERLTKIGRGVFGTFKVLDTLHIYRSGLTSVPDLSQFSTENQNMVGAMEEIDLSRNRIEVIRNGSFSGIKTNMLKLDSNRLKMIKNDAFKNSQILTLKLNNNPSLVTLEENAFEGIKDLESLDLSRTAITNLPTKGLSNIQELSLRKTKTLRKFPSILQFSKITKVDLYYPHHCCAFKNPEKQNPEKWKAYEFQRKIQQECNLDTRSTPMVLTTASTHTVQGSPDSAVTFSSRPRFWKGRRRRALEFNETGFQDLKSDGKNAIGFGDMINDSLGLLKPKVVHIPGSTFHGSTVSTNITDKMVISCGAVVFDYSKVICTPEPDAFNPCEDVMGYEWLRIFVWVVVMAALFGNVIVLIVLISSRSKMTVTKFLMCNLAFADFLMGIYLLLLASIDAHTLGEYFNYAILWQNEGGCQAAGFITVFSSELSIFTLTVITLERWYAISHAIHLTKRLKLRQAVVIMTFGWLYAVFMAHLPLVGISYYGNVSVCLPMKVEDTADMVYIISLLVLNGLAFVVICMCYVNMYFKVRGSECRVHSSDTTIAKRMAMLVFTNFICWAPIAFFGLTASAGVPLIDITNSKILLVFFYPLNSCANPYLYVIITKQFRKDMYVLLEKYGLCHEKANKYKGTFTNSKSLTQSRKDSLALNNLIHPVDVSLTTVSDSFKGSKDSLKVGTPNQTPNLNSRSPNLISKITSVNGNGSGVKQPERKLSIVPELCQTLDHTNQVSSLEGHDSSQLSNIKNGSDYVLFYRASNKDSSQACRHYLQEQTVQKDTLDCDSKTSSTVCDQCEESPWVLNDLGGNFQPLEPISESIIETEISFNDFGENRTLHHLKENDVQYDSDTGDDSVQQTLLKHYTSKESPVTERSKKIHQRHVISENIPNSPSSSSLDDIDETNYLCNGD